MKSNVLVSRLALGVYLLIFFGYLLGPLLVMSMTAFNSSAFPSVSPWECFTFEWFDVLFNDKRILQGIRNSVFVGIGTVILSVSMGLAASLVLTQVWPRWRSTYYTMIIAPILIPGVVLGISTVVFWDRLSRLLGPGTDALFHNGIFLTVLGQSTFIASYAMLVFVARLQRFDPGLTEAALDLGATHSQAFRKILLPFMRPAIASAAVLAFLASFENYNTTTFTSGPYPTLTIVLAQKVRLGINPSISALAFIIVVLTVTGALALEASRRNKARAQALKAADAQPRQGGGILPGFLRGNWAALALVLLAFVVITAVGVAQSYSPAQCKQQVREAKQAETARRIEELKRQRQIRAQDAARQGPDIFGGSTSPAQKPAQSAPAAPGGIFAPGNLQQQSGTGADGGSGGGSAAPRKPATPFGSIFDPNNLKEQVGAGNSGEGESGSAPPASAPPPAKPASPFGSIFDPNNLKQQSGTGN